MRCYICNSMLSKPVFNKDINGYEACPTCLEVIYSVFSDEPPEDTAEEVPLEDIEDIENIHEIE